MEEKQDCRFINGKIYMIISSETDKIYIGSTVETLNRRLSRHRSLYKRWKEGKKQSCITSYEIVKYTDCKIVLIEEYSCESKKELHTRERYYIENTENCCNMLIPSRSQKERRILNKDKIAQYQKEYHREYRELNKDKIKQQQNKYRELNKDKINQYKREWRVKKILEKERQKLSHEIE